MLFICGIGEDSQEPLGLQGDQTTQSHRKSVLNIHWEDWCWMWSANTLATWCEELTHWKRPWCWERLNTGREGNDRGWDGWMASPTQWTWVWACSRRWWKTGTPGILQSMGSQRVRQDWVTALTHWTTNKVLKQIIVELPSIIFMSLQISSHISLGGLAAKGNFSWIENSRSCTLEPSSGNSFLKVHVTFIPKIHYPLAVPNLSHYSLQGPQGRDLIFTRKLHFIAFSENYINSCLFSLLSTSRCSRKPKHGTPRDSSAFFNGLQLSFCLFSFSQLSLIGF